MHLFDEAPKYQLNIEDLKKDKVFWSCWVVMIAALFILIFAVAESQAQIIQPADVHEVVSILYAESAIDPVGWSPKLNTYNKARRSGETLAKSMQRVSSAYRTKSPQYKKAHSMRLTDYERRVYQRIAAFVAQFRPDPNWKYSHHENLSLYPNKQLALAHLKKAWGPGVDYENCRQIGKEYYFGRCK
jgi:hypothetical protein